MPDAAGSNCVVVAAVGCEPRAVALADYLLGPSGVWL